MWCSKCCVSRLHWVRRTLPHFCISKPWFIRAKFTHLSELLWERGIGDKQLYLETPNMEDKGLLIPLPVSRFLYLRRVCDNLDKAEFPNRWLRLSVRACWDHALRSGREHFHCILLLLRHPALEKDGKEIGASVTMVRLWHKILAFELWSSAVN